MMDYIIYGILGLISGLVFYYMAIHHVKVRSEYDNGEKLNMLKNKKFILVWMISATILFLIIASRGLEVWQMTRVMIFSMLAFNVAAVDALLRRIPNAILLGMMFLHIINIGVGILQGADAMDSIMTSITGLLFGYIIFLLPGIFKMSIGAGDVKYSAVIGFMMGFANYAEAMVVMAVAVLVFYLYLKITNTGNAKTAAPMGPFLSIGAFVAILFPMF